MGFVKHKCPHCLTEDMSFSVVKAYDLPDLTGVGALLVCGRCQLPACMHVVGGRSGGLHAAVFEKTPDPCSQGWPVMGFWPEASRVQIPEYLPADVERAFKQAEDNYARVGNEEAAGMMYRKALDVAVKKIDPSLSGTLGPKLKALHKQGKLTTDIAEWADHVRALGNEAAHDDTPIERDDLTDLRGLTDMVLRYLFSLPNLIRKRRGEPLLGD
ncbi:MAG: DUF4145 domain-containing protein [Hyphomicrobium sp.]|nr:DUF4145 domain-containing protein [Hyphomicrobium sp.]